MYLHLVDMSPIPLIPIYKTSRLPAIKRDSFSKAHMPSVIEVWKNQHGDKDAAVLLKPPLALLEFLSPQTVEIPNAVAVDWGQNPLLLVNTDHPSAKFNDHDVILHTNTYFPITSASYIPNPQGILPTDLTALGHASELQEKETSKAMFSAQLQSLTVEFALDLTLNHTNQPTLLQVINELEVILEEKNAPSLLDSTLRMLYQTIQYFCVKYKLQLHPTFDKGINTGFRDKYHISVNFSLKQRNYDDLRAFIYEKLSEGLESEGKMVENCQLIIEQMALSTAINKVALDQLKRFVSKQSGLSLNMSKMESQRLQLQREALGTDTVANISTRALEILQLQGNYKFDSDHAYQPALYYYNGVCWEVFADYKLIRLLQLYFPCEFTLRNATALNTIISTIKDALTSPIKILNQKGMNFANGILDINQQLKAHNPDLGMDYYFPFEYQNFPPPPEQFLAFLNECFGQHPEEERIVIIQTLRQAFAATLFNQAHNLQQAFLLYGSSNSGKTQLLRILSHLIPKQKQVSLPPNKWSDTDSLFSLNSVLLNVCGELSESASVNSQRFKEIVDGSTITVAKKTTSRDIKPQCAHWFASNHLPLTKDFSEGFTRRWLIFHFNNPTTKPVLELGRKIAEQEGEKIINWAASALPESEYKIPNSHLEIQREMAMVNNNVIYYFYRSGAVTVNNLNALKSLPKEELSAEINKLRCTDSLKLYQHYAYICSKHGKREVPEVEFHKRTRELASQLGFLVVSGADYNGNYQLRYYGIKCG